ncbi:hypothetical protein [Shewanella kaireitica]|uniref:hypothetical protein n=1 Tax=Shewanella kaireitica TaxID=212021 RepID=UPI002010352C|nr:hypothetical protein [Shewanella kaireitica]MCL1095727.1 hypothetical protein [Shewanella kaireitica]
MFYKVKYIFVHCYLYVGYLYASVFSLLKVIFFSNVFLGLKKTFLRKSDECVVLGNGPSINSAFEENISFFNDKDIYVVNYFALTKYFDYLKPSCYVLLDPLLFPNSSSDLESNNKLNDLINALNDVSWDLTIYVPYKFKGSIIFSKFDNRNLEFTFFNSTPIDTGTRLNYLFYSLSLGMPTPQTVINAAIFIAVNNEYSKIHLFGVEQSWIKDLSVSDNNEISVSLDHFYAGQSSLGRHSSLNTLSAFLHTQFLCFKSHEILNQYAIHRNVMIFNRTPNSYIDAYRKVVEK